MFHAFAQHATEETSSVNAFGELFWHYDLTEVLLLTRKKELDHGQIFSHGFQAYGPAVDSRSQLERFSFRKAVMGERVRYVLRHHADGSVQFSGEIRAPAARNAYDIDKVKA